MLTGSVGCVGGLHELDGELRGNRPLTLDTTVYAPVAPPAPYYEVQPPLPYPGAIWIGGYWNWSGHRHVWVPGRYERPRPGYHYAPHRWSRSPRGGWYLQGGGWIR